MAVDINSIQHPFSGLCEEWLRKIEAGREAKKERFQQYADEAMRFYDGAHDWMWKEEYARAEGGFLDKKSIGTGGMPTFRMTVNRVFEAVALFGPSLFHQYPHITVSPSDHPEIPPEVLGIDPDDPSAAGIFEQYLAGEQLEKSTRRTCAALKQHYLNWLQVETDKKTQARRSITEAIVKGLGILWTDIYQPRGSHIRYPRSVHVSCDDVVKDPDAKYAEDVQWISRERIGPVNLVERKYGLPHGVLKGQMQSKASQATVRGRKDARSGKSYADSFDLIRYQEIYSKNGFGQRLKSTSQHSVKSQFDTEVFGDFCHLVVAKDIPFPLNLPSWSIPEGLDKLIERTSWPIPFWTDEGCGNGWPMAELHFYEKANCVWPISLIKPAIGELRFVNWCLSFLADKVAASCTTYVAVAKKAGLEIQNQLQNNMAPFTVIELADILGKKASDVVSFLQAPEFNESIWRMVAAVLDLIDKRTGLTELIYGLTGTQMRSATEANVRDQNLAIRPDDMASRTEDWLSQSAMKEFEAAAWSLEGEHFLPVLGEAGTHVMVTKVLTQDFENIVRDYSYRVAAGSARKPNKPQKARALNEFGQVALSAIEGFAMQGLVGPWNAFMRDMGQALDLEVDEYLLDVPEQNGPSPEEVKAELEMTIKELELQIKAQSHALEIEHDDEAHEQELRQDEELHRQEMEQSRAKLKLEREKGRQQIKLAKEKARVAPRKPVRSKA